MEHKNIDLNKIKQKNAEFNYNLNDYEDSNMNESSNIGAGNNIGESNNREEDSNILKDSNILEDSNVNIDQFDLNNQKKSNNKIGLIVEDNTVYEFDEECIECLKNKKKDNKI